MARTPANFKELLWDLARMQELEPDEAVTNGGLSDEQSRGVLLDLNRGYNRAYRFTAWEDGWKSATLSPTDGVITYAHVQNASEFTLWTEDPRPIGSTAAPVAFKSSDAGIHPQVSGDVFAFWMPVCPRFTLTPYNAETEYTAIGTTVFAADGNCYELIQAATDKTPQDEPTYWRLLPVIEVLREAVLNLALSMYFTRTKQHGAAKKAEHDGIELLDNQAALEFPRISTWWWVRRQH